VSTLQRLVTPASTAAHAIKVVRLKVAIDKRLTVVDERSPAVLKYKTPHFRYCRTTIGVNAAGVAGVATPNI